MGTTTMCKDFWLIDYDRCCDDYGEHLIRFGDTEAIARLRANLKALGFDAHEIEHHVAEIVS